MKATIRMWKNTRMIVLTGVVAAIYASVEVVLAPVTLTLIPGVVGFRVSDILTMFLGMIFGPAGAFGVGIGNLIGDYFTGGLAMGSAFGFLSSFSVGYIGYTFWLGFREPSSTKIRQVVVYTVTGVVAAVASAVVLGLGLDLLRIAPFRLTSNTLVANFVIGNWAGGSLYRLVYHRIKSMRLTWTDLMDKTDIAEPKSATLGALLVIIGSFGGWVLGAFVLKGAALTLTVGVFFLLIVGGAFLL